MPWFMVATVIIWGIAILLALSVFRLKGFIRRLRRFVVAALWMSGGIALTALVLLQHAFSVFTGETLVATVVTHSVAPDAFELVYAPSDPHAAPVRTVLQGDQWSVSGGIVKWHPWLTLLGIKSYHRPMRLSGQFSNLEEQRRHTPTVEGIAEPGVDRFWEAVYWADPALPFVEAAYGSSAYAYVEPGRAQKLYVTPSGYLIKKDQTASR